jgi:hypothetical protein
MAGNAARKTKLKLARMAKLAMLAEFPAGASASNGIAVIIDKQVRPSEGWGVQNGSRGYECV